MTVVVRLQLRGIMRMIVRLQHVVGMIVLVALFACGMTVAVAVLMSVRVGVRVRVLMIVNRLAMAVLMPVCVSMPMLVLMPVLVLMPRFMAVAHEWISSTCLVLHARNRQFRPRRSFERSFYPALLWRVRGWQTGCNRRLDAGDARRLPKPPPWKRRARSGSLCDGTTSLISTSSCAAAARRILSVCLVPVSLGGS